MTRPGPASVRFDGALKRYGRVEAMRDLDLHIDEGRFVVLLGPSGSGKSTLVRCLAGVERLDGGTLHIGGNLVGDRRHHLPPERRNLGMVFQDYALWPHLSVIDNVAFALRRAKLTGTESHRRVVDVLERVGLAAYRDRYPHELSGGEQQRVALARAVVSRPALLLFDEPLSNLDADLRERLRVEIATLSRSIGSTVVYITHDQSEAFALADEIGVLDKGRLVQFGTPEDVYHRPENRFVARFTGLATEIPGTVTGHGEGGREVEVRVDSGHLVARRLSDIRVGESVTVAVRPAAVRIVNDAVREDARVAVGVRSVNGSVSYPLDSSAGTTVASGHLIGIVTDVAYRGRGYDHVVSVAGRILTGCFDSVRHDRGSAVTIALDPDGCVAFSSEGVGVEEPRELQLTAVRV